MGQGGAWPPRRALTGAGPPGDRWPGLRASSVYAGLQSPKPQWPHCERGGGGGGRGSALGTSFEGWELLAPEVAGPASHRLPRHEAALTRGSRNPVPTNRAAHHGARPLGYRLCPYTNPRAKASQRALPAPSPALHTSCDGVLTTQQAACPVAHLWGCGGGVSSLSAGSQVIHAESLGARPMLGVQAAGPARPGKLGN